MQRHPKDFAMKQGWVMVGSRVYSEPIMQHEPTQAQIDTLYDLGLYRRLNILEGDFYINYAKSKKG